MVPIDAIMAIAISDGLKFFLLAVIVAAILLTRLGPRRR